MRFLWPLLLGVLWPALGHAQLNPCPLGSMLPCTTGGAQGLASFISLEVGPELRIAFAGVLLMFLVYYAVRMIAESGDESTVTEIKQAYGYAVTGAILISVAGLIVMGVGNEARGTLINSEQGGPLWTIFSTIIVAMRWLLGVAVMATLAIQGMRLIVIQEESEMEKQKKRFFNAVVGVVIVVLASVLVDAVVTSRSGLLGPEVAGLVNFLLEAFGFLAVLSFIVAGIFLIFSVNEASADRAKTIMKGTVISLIVVFLSFAIVNFTLSV
jgi:hypothetical protein